MSAKVKCLACGFLAVRDEYNDSVCEATDFCRTRGLHKSSNGNATIAKFFCYRDSKAFQPTVPQQFAARALPSRSHEGLIRVDFLAVEIECDEFCIWRPGKTPREHEEMSLLQQVESRNRQWRDEEIKRQAESEDRAARWQKQVEALAEVHHQEQRRDTAKTRHIAWLALGATIFIGIGSFIISVLTLLNR